MGSCETRSFKWSTLCCLSRLVVLLGLASALSQAKPASCQDTGNKADPPNIVLILADDLGYGDLGCYGQQRIKTPQLDRMAREGMRFTDFYAGSTVCAPSRCVLMTGYHTGHARIRGNARVALRPQDGTLAEVLKSAGYKTGLTGKWGLGEEGTTGIPNRQGFDYFFGYLNQHHAHNYYPAFLYRNEERVELKNVVPGEGEFGGGVATEKVEYSHDLVAEEALKFVEKHRDEPFFLYVAFTTPHANNEAGKAGMEVPEYGPYANTDWPESQKGHAAMVSRMDADVGRLLAKLKELKLDERTLVIFTSDNGPHREGGNDPSFNDSNGPLKGIKRDLSEGGIRVPMIVRWPGKISAGATSDHVSGFQDMLPTLAEIAQADSAVPADIDGISFASTLLGQPEKQKEHDHLYWAFYEGGGAQAVRFGKWKAVQQPNDSAVRLYDLESDLGESRDVSTWHEDVVRQAVQKMRGAYVPSENWQFAKPGEGELPKQKRGGKKAKAT
jgi:arylsulfatase A-like enzyme